MNRHIDESAVQMAAKTNLNHWLCRFLTRRRIPRFGILTFIVRAVPTLF